MSHILSSGTIHFYAEHFGHIIIARAICPPFFGIKVQKSCFHSNHLNQNSEKKLLNKFLFFLHKMQISHREIYTKKKFKVVYWPIFAVIRFHVFSCVPSWYKWQQLGNHAYAQQWCAEMHARITLETFAGIVSAHVMYVTSIIAGQFLYNTVLLTH